MSIFDRFKNAHARRDQAIAASDAVKVEAERKRQAERDAINQRERLRSTRIAEAQERLTRAAEGLAVALSQAELDVAQYSQVDFDRVVIAAFRQADINSGLCSAELHWCVHSPTVHTLANIFSKNLYFLLRY